MEKAKHMLEERSSRRVKFLKGVSLTGIDLRILENKSIVSAITINAENPETFVLKLAPKTARKIMHIWEIPVDEHEKIQLLFLLPQIVKQLKVKHAKRTQKNAIKLILVIVYPKMIQLQNVF